MDTVASSYKTESKSTDKLQALADIVNRLPDKAFENISNMKLEWRIVDEEICPFFTVDYFEA